MIGERDSAWRQAAVAVVVAAADRHASIAALLQPLGLAALPFEEPYAAMASLCSRPQDEALLVLSLSALYRQELGIIPAARRLGRPVQIWVADFDGRSAALAEVMRLGVDALLGGEGLHRLDSTANGEAGDGFGLGDASRNSRGRDPTADNLPLARTLPHRVQPRRSGEVEAQDGTGYDLSLAAERPFQLAPAARANGQPVTVGRSSAPRPPAVKNPAGAYNRTNPNGNTPSATPAAYRVGGTAGNGANGYINGSGSGYRGAQGYGPNGTPAPVPPGVRRSAADERTASRQPGYPATLDDSAAVDELDLDVFDLDDPDDGGASVGGRRNPDQRRTAPQHAGEDAGYRESVREESGHGDSGADPVLTPDELRALLHEPVVPEDDEEDHEFGH